MMRASDLSDSQSRLSQTLTDNRAWRTLTINARALSEAPRRERPTECDSACRGGFDKGGFDKGVLKEAAGAATRRPQAMGLNPRGVAEGWDQDWFERRSEVAPVESRRM